MSDPDPIIEFREVRKSFGKLTVLDGVSLKILPGRTTVVIGPSGCGKSVLLKHMVGILKPDSGKVYFGGQDITPLSERQLVAVRRRMGFLFQGGALFDSMSVEENICFPLVEHEIGDDDERSDRAREVLQLVGLGGLQHRLPVELSGGQRKRIALARAIAMHPDVIYYDEPTTGLDPIRSDLINELILKLQDELGVTSVVVTHDMASTRKVGDRVLMLNEGRFIADADPDRLERIDNDAVSRFIHGEASPEELKQISGEALDEADAPAS